MSKMFNWKTITVVSSILFVVSAITLYLSKTNYGRYIVYRVNSNPFNYTGDIDYENTLRKRIRDNPRDLHSLQSLSRYLKSDGRFREAEVVCRDIVEKYPNALNAQDRLAEVCLLQGKREEAEHAWNGVVSKTNGLNTDYARSWRKNALIELEKLRTSESSPK